MGLSMQNRCDKMDDAEMTYVIKRCMHEPTNGKPAAPDKLKLK